MVIFYGQQILQRQKNMKDFRDDRQFCNIHMKILCWTIAKFLRKPIFKNIRERLLLDHKSIK